MYVNQLFVRNRLYKILVLHLQLYCKTQIRYGPNATNHLNYYLLWSNSISKTKGNNHK